MPGPFVASSPPSGGTAPTPPSASVAAWSTPATAVVSTEKKPKDVLLDEVELSIKTMRIDDPFLVTPGVKPAGLSPTAEAFTPGQAISSDEVLQIMSTAFSSSRDEPKRAVLVQKGLSSHTEDSQVAIKSRIEFLLKRNKVFPVSLVLPPSATAASFSDQLLLQFDDVRDAGKAYDIAIDNIKSADVYFLDPKAAARYAGETDVSTYNDISSYNDEVIITLVCKEDPPFANYNELVHFIVSSISRCFSKPKAFACLAPHGLEFRVEFFKKTTAISAVACGAIDYDTHRFEFRTPTPRDVDDIRSRADPALTRSSATGRSMVPSGRNNYEFYRQPTFSGRRYGRHSGHNNNEPTIILGAIQDGNDCRTTVMLRNIPNRITRAQLKAFIDETNFGSYDFIYLRIDFKTGCNVGYAFINFGSAEDIIPFAMARQGRPWPWTPNSFKKAEISYATVQGIENLIGKFRNSSVMFENPEYIPQLYHLGTGVPAEFPSPDNASKVQRSMEIAETVGLFNPNPKPYRRKQKFIPPPRSQRERGGFYSAPARLGRPKPIPTYTPSFGTGELSPTGRTQMKTTGRRSDFGPIGPPSSSGSSEVSSFHHPLLWSNTFHQRPFGR